MEEADGSLSQEPPSGPAGGLNISDPSLLWVSQPGGLPALPHEFRGSCIKKIAITPMPTMAR